MKLFELVGNKLTYALETLAVKEFKAIWNRDTSTTKDLAIQELAFIYYVSDYLSVYHAYDSEIRRSKVIHDVIETKDWKPDKSIEDAILKYEELQETASMGLLKDAETAVFNIRQYLKDFNPKLDKTGKHTETLIKNIKSLGDLISGISTLREVVRKEESEAVRTRGGGDVRTREVPRTKN